MPNTSKTLYFIYDGECPICQLGASLYRLKETVGHFETLDARTMHDHTIIKEVNERGFDLDEGMVIKFGDDFYQGDDALNLLAKLGANKGVINSVHNHLYRYKAVARFFYPFMKAARNLLLKIKGVKKINNLKNFADHRPVFQNIFGTDIWNKLPSVFHKHYANRPFSNDEVIVTGHLDVTCKWYLKPFLNFFNLMPPITEKDVKTVVTFTSEKNNNHFNFNRVFHFSDHPPYAFNSYMRQIKENEIAETMAFGVSWHTLFSYDDEYILMEHKGYSWKIMGVHIPLPISWLVGSGNAKEWAISDDKFAMEMTLTHPLWGKLYEYKGSFEITGINQ